MKELLMKEKLEIWLRDVNAAETVPDGIAAINIGLFESEEGYCAYMTGSENYDEDDDDWACDIDFEPACKYLSLTDALPESLSGWEDVFDYVVTALRAILTQEEIKELPLFKGRVVTVGFDDGELLRIQ